MDSMMALLPDARSPKLPHSLVAAFKSVDIGMNPEGKSKGKLCLVFCVGAKCAHALHCSVHGGGGHC